MIQHNNGERIGVALPSIHLPRWIYDGSGIRAELERLGYSVDLQFAGNDMFVQINQIEDMITMPVRGLIITPVEPRVITGILREAVENNIPVVAYDRLLTGTDAVSYYASFDNEMVGALMAQYIERALGLAGGAGPFNIEIFAGSPDDYNAYETYRGAMEVLQPYIDSGQLVIQSGQKGFNETWTLQWSGEEAEERMEDILDRYYRDEKLHAVLALSDGLAAGVVRALEDSGYVAGEDWPVVTGQDAEIAAVKRIIEGKQAMSVFKDTRILSTEAARILDKLIRGEPIERETFNATFNGVIMVPTVLIPTEVVDINNYREVLIDSGYYTPEELGIF